MSLVHSNINRLVLLPITIFLLLWINSNNVSMKFFGKWWKYFQRLSYLSIIFLILHTFDAQSKVWIVLAGLLVIEAFSWGYLLH